MLLLKPGTLIRKRLDLEWIPESQRPTFLIRSLSEGDRVELEGLDGEDFGRALIGKMVVGVENMQIVDGDGNAAEFTLDKDSNGWLSRRCVDDIDAIATELAKLLRQCAAISEADRKNLRSPSQSGEGTGEET